MDKNIKMKTVLASPRVFLKASATKRHTKFSNAYLDLLLYSYFVERIFLQIFSGGEQTKKKMEWAQVSKRRCFSNIFSVGGPLD